MEVTGYWPLDGSSGVSFLKKAVSASAGACERQIESALQKYVKVAEEIASGIGNVEVEPENFAVFVESEGGVEKAKQVYGIWEEGGRYWMRQSTFSAANRAFVACAILFCSRGGSVTGEIYNGCEQAIERCAAKFSQDQVEALMPLAHAAVEALAKVGDLSVYKNSVDGQLIANELRKFAMKFSGG
jgi:hypothetical protein